MSDNSQLTPSGGTFFDPRSGQTLDIPALKAALDGDELFEVWIAAGQSNMVGSDGAFPHLLDEGVEATLPIGDGTNYTATPAMGAAYSGVYIAGLDGSALPSRDQTIHINPGTVSASPEGGTGIAYEFAKRRRAAGAKVIIVGAGESGTLLHDGPWDPDALGGTDNYQQVIDRVNGLIASGVRCWVRGVLWHQGEADAIGGVSAADYKTSFLAMIDGWKANIRHDALGDHEHLDVVIGGMSGELTTNGYGATAAGNFVTIDTALQELGNENAGFVYVDASDLDEMRSTASDLIHFNTRELVTLADRYHGASYLAMLERSTAYNTEDPSDYKGTWSASEGGSFPSGANSGYTYAVASGTRGTVDGIYFSEGDLLMAIVDGASTSTYAGNWIRIERQDILKLEVLDGATNKYLVRQAAANTRLIANKSYVINTGLAGQEAMLDEEGHTTSSLQGSVRELLVDETSGLGLPTLSGITGLAAASELVSAVIAKKTGATGGAAASIVGLDASRVPFVKTALQADSGVGFLQALTKLDGAGGGQYEVLTQDSNGSLVAGGIRGRLNLDNSVTSGDGANPNNYGVSLGTEIMDSAVDAFITGLTTEAFSFGQTADAGQSPANATADATGQTATLSSVLNVVLQAIGVTGANDKDTAEGVRVVLEKTKEEGLRVQWRDSSTSNLWVTGFGIQHGTPSGANTGGGARWLLYFNVNDFSGGSFDYAAVFINDTGLIQTDLSYVPS
jgi:hypothetical protein